MGNSAFALKRVFASLTLLMALGSAPRPAVAAAALPQSFVPVHGLLVAAPAGGSAMVRLAPVSGAPAPVTGLFALNGSISDPDHVGLVSGAPIDALMRLGTRQLQDIVITPPSIAGLPDSHVATQLAVGDRVPNFLLVDQTGRRFTLADLRGKMVLLSFFYTRCPDREICPAISGRFAYLQKKIDSDRAVMLELSLDPEYDTPATLAAYGQQFGADPRVWQLATAEPHTIADALASFGLSNLESHRGNFIHDDVLAFIDRDGRLAQLVTTAGWAPDDVLATVASLTGLPSNPFARLELLAVANLLSACGGSTTAAVAVMDSIVFVLGVGIFGGILFWFGRKIWNGAPP